MLEKLRAVINRADDRRRGDTLLAHGFHGRDQQRQLLQDWLAAPLRAPPVLALFVTGLPGIGKSALLESAIREQRATQQPIIVRLDFDRPTLDVLDQVGLTLEAARQIAAQLPDQAGALRELRLRAASAGSGSDNEALKGRGRDSVPSELVAMLGGAVSNSGRSVVVVLDTCEVLRGRGETHPRRLFIWLDVLVSLGLAPMAVIAAGRGDAFDSAPERIGRRLALEPLAPETTELMLDQADVPSAARFQLRAFAKGNPLLLRLGSAALIAAPEATAVPMIGGRRQFRRLGGIALGAAPKAEVPSKRSRKPQSKDLVAAHLYRFLLSRISGPALRRIVDPGLLIRRINFEVIRDVLAPTLGLKRIGDARAKNLADQLESQNWLIERGADGWLRQRAAPRAELVPLLYASKPALCAKLDRAAAEWFARATEPPQPWRLVEATYHRLQLLRRGEAAPKIDRDTALRVDDATLAELPDAARDAVLHARGQRSTAARGSSAARRTKSAKPDPRSVKDLQLTIERGDWIEAADLYAREFEKATIDPASEAGDAVRTLLWRTGRWQQARAMLRQLDAKQHDDSDIRALRPDDALARIEMRAELSFKAATRRLVIDGAWREWVQVIVGRGAKTEMTEGALGFALRAAGVPVSASWRHIDPVAAAFEQWADNSSGTATANALAAAAARLARRLPQGLASNPQTATAVGSPTGPDQATVRRLMVHSPYAASLCLLAQLEVSRRLTTHARAALIALAKCDLPLNSGLAGIAVNPNGPAQEPIEILSDVGLVNEWAGAASFVLGGRDCASIAKSAETWRRTMCGHWSYGRAPEGWHDAESKFELDSLTTARVQELLGAGDPGSASRSLLLAWSSAEDALPQKLRARLAALAARARSATARRKGETRALEAARTLMKAGVPAAFIPALSTLVATNQKL
nr:ATP-binding protein [Rhodopseudomonas rhenobacensis]